MTHMPPESNDHASPDGVQPNEPYLAPQQPQPQYAPQGQYAPPQQPQYAPQAPYAPKPPTNALAIVSLISAFFVSIVAIILGHIALAQIKRTGESGRGLALAGTIIGYVSVGLTVIGVTIAILFFGLLGTLGLAAGSAGALNSLDSYDSTGPTTTEPDAELSYEDPWIGTPDEAFCNMLHDYELDVTDPQAYAEGLRDTTSDPEFKGLAETQLEYLSGAKDVNSDEYSAHVEAWYDAQYEAIDACWAY